MPTHEYRGHYILEEHKSDYVTHKHSEYDGYTRSREEWVEWKIFSLVDGQRKFWNRNINSLSQGKEEILEKLGQKAQFRNKIKVTLELSYINNSVSFESVSDEIEGLDKSQIMEMVQDQGLESYLEHKVSKIEMLD